MYSGIKLNCILCAFYLYQYLRVINWIEIHLLRLCCLFISRGFQKHQQRNTETIVSRSSCRCLHCVRLSWVIRNHLHVFEVNKSYISALWVLMQWQTTQSNWVSPHCADTELTCTAIRCRHLKCFILSMLIRYNHTMCKVDSVSDLTLTSCHPHKALYLYIHALQVSAF